MSIFMICIALYTGHGEANRQHTYCCMVSGLHGVFQIYIVKIPWLFDYQTSSLLSKHCTQVIELATCMLHVV